jgi:hypothetical protein
VFVIFLSQLDLPLSHFVFKNELVDFIIIGCLVSL